MIGAWGAEVLIYVMSNAFIATCFLCVVHSHLTFSIHLEMIFDILTQDILLCKRIIYF